MLRPLGEIKSLWQKLCSLKLHYFFLQNIKKKKSYGFDMQAVHHSALAEPAK